MSSEFQPIQLITHMFMHGGPMHIFFNMFVLITFGPPLETRWGAKKFLLFYLACGAGSALAHMGVQYYEYTQAVAQLTPEVVEEILNGSRSVMTNNTVAAQSLMSVVGIPVVGASGAIYGVVAGFAMLFPNTQLMLLFPPIPIKAKFLVPILIVIDLLLGVSSVQTGVAHFAHLGGALVGFLLVLYWKNTNQA